MSEEHKTTFLYGTCLEAYFVWEKGSWMEEPPGARLAPLTDLGTKRAHKQLWTGWEVSPVLAFS